MAEAGAEVLPESSSTAGIVRREKQRQHKNPAADACGPHEDAEDERDADRKLTIGHEKSNRRSVSEHKSAKYRRHEGIGPAVEKSVDPVLETAVKCELCAENFVLAKDEEENTDANA